MVERNRSLFVMKDIVEHNIPTPFTAPEAAASSQQIVELGQQPDPELIAGSLEMLARRGNETLKTQEHDSPLPPEDPTGAVIAVFISKNKTENAQVTSIPTEEVIEEANLSPDVVKGIGKLRPFFQERQDHGIHVIDCPYAVNIAERARELSEENVVYKPVENAPNFREEETRWDKEAAD